MGSDELLIVNCKWIVENEEYGMSGGEAVLLISFACPKETNQRKRPQQNQPQFFLRLMAIPALTEKLRFALLLDPLRTRCEEYSMFNKE